MPDLNSCPKCGAPLPNDGALGGGCPRCMLELGFETTVGTGERQDPRIVAERPAVIGRYRILRLIGEGGMGAVYEAEQDHPRRTVALKIIKSGMASAELLRRFEQESQALGRLQHPGIAQIYEAGTVDTGFGPQPYFAMEFIRGRSPREYAEANQLGARDRLQMMVKICDAVHHAHQRGLIHRDLKPGNILIDETGQPKILDFGVARVTDSDARATLQTDMGQLIGTLAYMSPEQALADPLDIDTRSDVYSLGVILYELLADRLPYTVSKKVHEAIQSIREEDPARLSASNRTLRGDIETIVAKALEKDKTRRYQSASEFSGDLQRYLNDQPIGARPPSTIYQIQKFTRRHMALVGGVSGVFLALVIGVVAIAWMANLYHLERDHATIEASKANAVLEFMGRNVFGLANPYAQGGSFETSQARTSPNPNITLNDALDSAVQQIPEFHEQPLLEAAVREFAADSYIGSGRYSEGRDQLSLALDIRRHEQGYRNLETLQTTVKLADDLLNLKLFSKAEELAKQVVIDARSTKGDVDLYVRRAVSTLVYIYSETFLIGDQSQGFPKIERFLKDDVIDYQRRKFGAASPTVQFAIGGMLSLYAESKPPKYSEAAAFMKQIESDWRRALGEDDPVTLKIEKQLIGLYMIPQPQPKYAEAERYLIPLVAAKRRILGDDNPATQTTLNYLVSVYLDREEPRYAEAETILKKVKEDSHGRLGDDSRAVQNASFGLARLYFKQARYKEAVDILTPLVSNRAVDEAKSGSVPLEIQPAILNDLDRSQIYGDRSNSAPGDSIYRFTMTEKPTILDSLDLLAQIYFRVGNSAGANVTADKVRTILIAGLNSAQKLEPGSESSVTALKSIGAIAIRYIHQGRLAEAESLLNTVTNGYGQLAASSMMTGKSTKLLSSPAMANAYPGNDSQTNGYQQQAGGNTNARDIATLLASAAITYTIAGHDQQAEKLLKTIVEIDHSSMGDSNWNTQRSLWRLWCWYVGRGRFADAQATYSHLHKIQTDFYGPQHVIARTTMIDTYGYLERQAPIESAAGRKVSAQHLLETILDVRTQLLTLFQAEIGGDKSGNTRITMSGVGITLAMLGRYPAAAGTFEQLIEIQDTAEGVTQESKPMPIANLGWTQFHQQKFTEAESNLRKALILYDKISSTTWERYNTESMLGATLVVNKKYEEAEKYLLESYEKLLDRVPGPGPASSFTAESVRGERILSLYQKWGRTEKVAEWRKRLDADKTTASAASSSDQK